MIWNWFRQRPLLTDSLLVGGLLLATTTVAVHHHYGSAGIALGVLEALLLLLRRQQPLLVTAGVTAVALAMIGLDVWLLPLQLGVALYTLGAARLGTTRLAAGAASIAAVALALPFAGGFEFGNAASRVVFLIAAIFLGDSVGSRRAYVREIEEKAARLEAERQTDARRAAAEEQARIARELHDVVAHALSVIIVQAGAAVELFAREPERAQEPIRSIDTAARAALGDLRRVLGILHEDTEYAPQPALDRIDELLDQVRATGLQVALELEGKPRPLPAAVELSAYRIVQEALTNTLKHAHAEHVRLRIGYGDELRLEVRDDGDSIPNGDTGGSGLIGMRERVSLLGGRLQTGPIPSGGYLVSVSIPTGLPG